MPYEVSAVALGDLLRGQKNYTGAAAGYEQINEVQKPDPEAAQKAALGAGEMYDLLHKRDLALKNIRPQLRSIPTRTWPISRANGSRNRTAARR